MEYKICLVFLLILSVVSCNQCIQKDLNDLFISNSILCNQRGSWTFRKTISVDKNDDVKNFLTPTTKSSCITSRTLSLSKGGVLEFKLYSKSLTKEDYLTVFVYDEEDNNIVGHIDFSEENNEVNDGWHVLNVTLEGVEDYRGYFTLIGESSLNSAILVESICFSPPHQSNTLSKDTSNIYPYPLPTSSIIMYQVHPKQNEIDIIDLDVENRSFWIFDREDFWTPLTISLAVIIPVIILALLCWACFALGRRTGNKNEPQIIYEDVDNLPKPYLVPRVKNVYAESVASTYGGRNNNIYSV